MPPSFLQQAFGQMLKDDVNGFSSTSDIYLMDYVHYVST